jgi:hypothetical protein
MGWRRRGGVRKEQYRSLYLFEGMYERLDVKEAEVKVNTY